VKSEDAVNVCDSNGQAV